MSKPYVHTYHLLTVSVFLASNILFPSIAYCAQSAFSTKIARRNIEQAYLKESKAIQARDIGMSLRDTSPHWYMITPDGSRFTYAMLRKNLATVYSHQIFASNKLIILHFALKNQEAYVTTKDHIKQVSKNPGSQKLLTSITDSLSVDNWIYTQRHWVLASTKMLSFRMTDAKVPVVK